MRLSTLFLVFSSLVFAAAVATFAAVEAANYMQERSRDAAEVALTNAGHDWVDVEADGLLVSLSGTAATEAERFRALRAVAGVVDASRLIDEMQIVAAADVPPPLFSVEMLRNDDGISLIGLVPETMALNPYLDQLDQDTGGVPVADLMEGGDYPIPEGFPATFEFALGALADLPRAKISVTADRVAITAAAASEAERLRVRADLARRASDSFVLALEISAPRPVVTPFTLRFLIDADGARFDACSADTEAARDQILKAAVGAGLKGQAECTLALGVPSPSWGASAAAAIAALGALGQGAITFSDADVTLLAAAETPQSTFDRVSGELQTALGDVFSLQAVLQEPQGRPRAEDAPPEFTATLSPEGQVQLRGRVNDEMMRAAVTSFAQARFGAEAVYVATRPDPGLPNGWPIRVLTGVEALAHLARGSVVVGEDRIELRGETGNREARALVAQLLADKLGGEGDYAIDVTYREILDPLALIPTPEECVARVNGVQETQKISFDPGAATINADALGIIDQLAEALTDCEEVPIEIAGHTDSQGRESMNLALSQTRAEAVIDALLARRVRTGNLVARGYGESQPIADNGTEEGREINRRIEFTLVAEASEATEAETEAAEAATDETAETPADE